MNQKDVEKIIVGAALAITASTLLPVAKNTIGPLTETARQGALGFAARAKMVFQYAREEVEDIIAEAQFARMKKQLDQEIAAFGAEEEQ